MKKVLLLFFLFSFFLSGISFAKNHYCIQISAVPITDLSSIWKDKKVASFLRTRDDCIMDKRKGGAYYGICCGDYLSYKASLHELKNIKHSFPGAFPRPYNTEKAEKIEAVSENGVKHSKKIISKKHVVKTEKQYKKPKSIVEKKKKPLEEKEITIEPQNDFEDFFSRNIVNARRDAEYENFSLQKYLKKLLETDKNFKIRELDSKIYNITPNIEQDKYNPNVYFSAGATLRKTYNVGNATNYASLDTLAALHLDWHLYDGQKEFFTNERKVIFNRLSKLNLLEAKDNVILNGIYTYMDLWYLQKIIDKYNFLLQQQERVTKIIKVRALRGGSTYIYAPIDSQNDLYTLDLNVSDVKENYIQQEYIFRQSIELASKKSIYLYDPVYNEMNKSLGQLQKEAIANNRELARLQEQYKLSKSDLVLEAARQGWSIDFNSYGGYGYSKEIEGTKRSGDGLEWQVGLRATYPLSQRKDITYQVERRKLLVKQAMLRVSNKIKTLLTSVSKLYNSVKKLQYKENIYIMQNKILKERLNISYNRFMKGAGSYKDYSDTLRAFTENLRAKLINETMLHASILQLYLVTGKNLF